MQKPTSETTPPPGLEDATDKLDHMWGDVPEVIREMFHRFPFGETITLSNGRTGRFAKFFEPKVKEDGATGTGWTFGIDFRFDKGSPDHFEFITKHTGGGGFV